MRFHMTPEPLLYLITTFLLLPQPAIANPPAPTSSLAGFNYNELLKRWDCDSGTKAAPKTPCSKRNATISVNDPAMPHSIDATVNPIIEIRYSRFSPNRADNHPTGAVMIAAAVIYDVNTHVI